MSMYRFKSLPLRHFSLAFPFSEFRACGSMKRLIEVLGVFIDCQEYKCGGASFCWSCPTECKTTVRMLSFPYVLRIGHR